MTRGDYYAGGEIGHHVICTSLIWGIPRGGVSSNFISRAKFNRIRKQRLIRFFIWYKNNESPTIFSSFPMHCSGGRRYRERRFRKTRKTNFRSRFANLPGVSSKFAGTRLGEYAFSRVCALCLCYLDYLKRKCRSPGREHAVVQDRRDVGCERRDVDIDFSAVCTSIVECALYIMPDRAGVRNVGYAVRRLYRDARNRRERL